ncbi:MAG: hypothetical protein OSB70_11585 [Myxococcota bacterium]|nr:hypothetical protein [Myxococcota bacterium]
MSRAERRERRSWPPGLAAIAAEITALRPLPSSPTTRTGARSGASPQILERHLCMTGA